jgi:hypothetical protein
MDGERFDHVTRTFWNRRGLLRAGAGGALAGWIHLLSHDEEAGAKKKGKKKSKKKKDTGLCSACKKSADFPLCCLDAGLCCPTVLPQCCPFACCPEFPYSCGPSSSAPCLLAV